MSKKGYISRYLLILKKLEKEPYPTLKELQKYIEEQLCVFQKHNDDTLNVGYSERTLQRDFREIRNLFGISIEYSASQKGYYIDSRIGENMNFQRVIDAFDMFNSLNIADDLTPYVHIEKRRPQGTNNLYGLIHAIKNRLQIKFTYQKYWDEKPSIRKGEPYALKEFKNRWYVLVCDLKDQKIKSFALDRLTGLEISKTHFKYPENFNVTEYYRYSFGIISPNVQQTQDIILSFEPFQGKYIKSLPLHSTQEIIKDTDNELRIKLKIHITHDFIMELLSFGETVKVLEPKNLAKEMCKKLEAALKNY